jgi:ribosomal protein S18 acetylase RimI-like enzyme
MNLRFQSETENIDWNLVSEILRNAGMKYYSGEIHRRAFNNSFTTIFAFDGDMLVGFGRAISDGEYQAAIYDVAVIPEYQKKGIGRMIIRSIMERIPGCNFILYSSPDKEKFYEKLGFRRMKTGMALFTESEIMRRKGFTE